MTAVDDPIQTAQSPPSSVNQPFAPCGDSLVLEGADWDFYERFCELLADRKGFTTFYKGKLEFVSVSGTHEHLSRIIYSLIKALAEHAEMPVCSVGGITMRDKGKQIAVEADESFYLGRTVERVRQSFSFDDVRLFDPAKDPPPDLAIETEITRRLGERKLIYRELGVREIWTCGSGGLQVLINRDDHYEQLHRSPTFPQLSPQEMYGFIQTGLDADETAWIKTLRKRLNELTT